MTKKADKIFFWITILLAFGGFFIFTSASLGLLARESGAAFSDVFFNQVVLGLFLGLGAFVLFSYIDYRFLRRISPYFFVGAVMLTLLVFVDGIGYEHNGARRWIDARLFSFQPTEFLKLAFVCFFASWLAAAKEKVRTLKGGLLPLVIMLLIMGAIILSEPDAGTFGVIAATGLVMFFAGGGKWRHIFALLAMGAIALAALAFTKPYIQDRITTFLHPEQDSRGSGYHIQQSLIAVGSGGLVGRGFGQSIQKFNYLPEPTNDAIFAVAAEEFGFAGGMIIIAAFFLYAWRGIVIAYRAPDAFSRLLVVGLIFLIVVQSFMNIASMLGLFPLTGVPLLFVSHGGTALMTVLAESGIILGVSKHMRKG